MIVFDQVLIRRMSHFSCSNSKEENRIKSPSRTASPPGHATMFRRSLYFLLLLSLVTGERVKRQFANYCFPRLQPPRNGYFAAQCPNILGSTCTIGCLPGTILIGESRLTCLPDTRTWNAPLPLCIPNPASGGASGLPGYGQQGIVIGPGVGIPPGTGIYPGGTSLQIVCPALSPPANGIRSGNCDRAVPGTVCLFSCLSGFVLSGYPLLNCGQNGQWTPQVPPVCMTQGPVYPPVYPGGVGTGVQPIIMATPPPMVVTTIVPVVVIPLTTQRPVSLTCPPLISPANGMAQGTCTNAVPNSQPCFFSCVRGFVLSGLPVLTCLAGGRWSGSPPTCRGITRVPFVPYRACGSRGVFGCRCRTCNR